MVINDTQRMQLSGNQIINAKRQTGKTSVTIARVLHNMIFNGSRVMYMSAAKAMSDNAVRVLMAMFNALPDWLRLKSLSNFGLLALENGSSVSFTHINSDFVKMETALMFDGLDSIVIDELSCCKEKIVNAFMELNYRVMLTCVDDITIIYSDTHSAFGPRVLETLLHDFDGRNK
jgi:hypothetical protein